MLRKYIDKEKEELIQVFIMKNMKTSTLKYKVLGITSKAVIKSGYEKLKNLFRRREPDLKEITIESIKEKKISLEEKIEIKNTSEEIRKGWYEWAVFLQPKNGNKTNRHG